MIEVIVLSRSDEAQGICSFELGAAEGGLLPAFSPGAHIDLHLPNGLVRQYSLCNTPQQRHAYQIGVLNSPDSRGGSQCVHRQLQPGSRLHISAPRNLFELDPGAGRTLLFAGGIGITPLLCMAEHLAAGGAPFELHYSARSRDRAAFLGRLLDGPFRDLVHLHFDEEPATHLNAEQLLASPAADLHLYVCGPGGFMEHILGAASRLGWSTTAVHREYFTAQPVATGGDTAFTIKVASTGQLIEVPANRSAIQALHAQGFDIPISCEQGVCGTCLTRVLSGVPEHRDLYLTEQEQACNDQFTPCCSRARTPLLILDL